MSGTRTSRSGAALLLVLAIVLAYATSWRNGFVAYDDPDYVTTNPHVASGLSAENVRWAFTRAHAANWHPATWIAHMAAVELFGLEPRGHHALSLALHALNACLLLALLVRFGARAWTAWVAAAAFALHPLRVESVAWVSELKDVLSACFALLALLAWTAWTERRGAARYLLALAAFAGGLLAKPTLVTLPFVLLLLDVWPLARVHETGRVRCWSLLLAEKLPLLALAAAASVATVLAQGAGDALGASEHYPLAGRIANALHAYRAYLTQTVWPVELVPFYPYEARGFGDASVVKGALALALFTFLAWRARTKRPWFLVAWLWFAGTLVPMIGLVQVGGQSHADRYTYLPHVGLALALAFALEEVGAGRRRLVGALAGATLVALGAATAAQVGVWRSSETLFRHALARGGRSYVMENGLADHYLEVGRAADALAIVERTARDWPFFRKARYNHMRALAELGRLDEARAVRDDWLARVPGDVGFTVELALACLREGAVEAAEREAAAAFATHPTLVDLRRELGLGLLLAGRAEDGYQALQFASTLRSGDAELAREAEGARQLAREPDRLRDAARELAAKLARRAAEVADRLDAHGEPEAARALRDRRDALEAARGSP